mmetsp:Transcript_114165/g.207661  ORF Transcript_114165/g.207661 Transcript_114165/m.207661 type:complete len:390 (+) Transcript_114165:67-1236(+)
MSSMSRAFVFGLTLGIATAADPWEWKGVFYTPEDTYKWGAEKVSGKYADPAMKLAAIPVANATETMTWSMVLAGADSKGKTALGLQCEEVQSGGVITPMENKCYSLKFNAQSSSSIFTVNAASATAIAFFAEHVPTEFEDTNHYFKDTTGVDIEPVSQEPDSGHSHAHGHGGQDQFDSKCVCQAQKHSWKLDCTAQSPITAAVNALEADAACKATNPSEACIDNYYIMQAHHDHCLHDQIPTGIEKILHDYEHFYDDCFVKRQFNPNLNKCPDVDCANAQVLTEAIATLQGGCMTTQTCAEAACSAAIKTVLMAHDVCPEKVLPNNLETALHDHEVPCKAVLCNSADAAFNPYSDPCAVGTADAARGLGFREALLVTTLAVILAVFVGS